MRLIDADAFMLDFCHTCDGWCEDLQCDCLNCKKDDCRCSFMVMLAEEPTVDAVPVVRCRECKYYHTGTFTKVPITTDFPLCFRLKNEDGEPVGYAFSENHYCAYGERKEEEHDETV